MERVSDGEVGEGGGGAQGTMLMPMPVRVSSAKRAAGRRSTTSREPCPATAPRLTSLLPLVCPSRLPAYSYPSRCVQVGCS